MSKRKRVLFWGVGIPALLGLNLWRDLRRSLERYSWDPVQISTLHKSVSSPGVMEANQVAEIKSEVEEAVNKIWTQEGAPVKAGQNLMELTRTQTQLEFEYKKTAFMNAEAEYKKSVRELAVQKKLLKDLAVSRSQVEDAAFSMEKLRSGMEISRQEFEISRKKLDSTLVRSPMDGVVLKIHLKPGERVSPGKPLITVGDISRFMVRTQVDELDIQSVKLGQPVLIRADAFANQAFGGRVRSIASQAERDVFAKIEVLIDIIGADNKSLKHNLSVRINIHTEDIPNAIGIPAKSVLRKSGETGWVLVRNKWNMVHERKIKLGAPAGDEIQVLSGLKAGDRVGTERVDAVPL